METTVSPVLYTLCSALVLHALNMPTYALQYVLSISICTNERQNHQVYCKFKACI